MPKPYSPDDIPRTGDVVAGMIEWEVGEDTDAGTTDSGKFCVKATFVATAPEDVEGRMAFETFTIGTDKDPEANDPMTLTKHATLSMKLFRDLVAACQIATSRDIERDAQLCRGKRFVGLTVAEVQKDGQYAGSVKSRIKKFYKLGEKPLAIRDVDEWGKMGPPRLAGATPPPMAASTPPPPPPPPAAPAATPSPPPAASSPR